MKKIVLYFCLLLSFSSYAQTHYEEIIRDEKGRIKTIITYNEKEIKDGYTLHYHPNTLLKSEIPYVEGKINGYISHYYPNGNMESTGLIANDVQQGLFEYYHSNGRLKAKMIFMDGKPQLIASCYDKKNNKLYCGPFNNGNGEIYLYDEKGTLIGKDHFKNGELIHREIIN